MWHYMQREVNHTGLAVHIPPSSLPPESSQGDFLTFDLCAHLLILDTQQLQREPSDRTEANQ